MVRRMAGSVGLESSNVEGLGVGQPNGSAEVSFLLGGLRVGHQQGELIVAPGLDPRGGEGHRHREDQDQNPTS